MPPEELPTDRLVTALIGLEIEGVSMASGLLNVRVIDLGWGPTKDFGWVSESLERLLTDFSVTFHRPKRGACSDSTKFVSVVRSYLGTQKPDELLILLLARCTRQWSDFRDALRREIQDKKNVAMLCLSDAATRDHTVGCATGELAALIETLAAGPAVRSQEELELEADLDLGERVRERSGLTLPLVLAVGGNEKQQHAADEFPVRVQQRLRLQGLWIFTDYDRPERVVAEIENICDREKENEKPRLILVIFSQFFNATNVKRDGQAALRKLKIMSLTPAFKSVGSAFGALKEGLNLYVGPSDEEVLRELGEALDGHDGAAGSLEQLGRLIREQHERVPGEIEAFSKKYGESLGDSGLKLLRILTQRHVGA